MPEKIQPNFSWDQYFMTMAYLVSMKSKDPSTRVGAVIVGEDNAVRATGYNGLPRDVADTASRYHDRDYKLDAASHAEENAVLHCARIGLATKGTRLYCPWIPCSRCARLIIQAGISKVIYDVSFPGNQEERDWAVSIKITKELFAEAGVELQAFDEKLVFFEGLYAGKQFKLNIINNEI